MNISFMRRFMPEVHLDALLLSKIPVEIRDDRLLMLFDFMSISSIRKCV